MNGNIEIVILIVILIVSMLFVVLLNYCAGRRRDWKRDDDLQEEAIREIHRKRNDDGI